MRGESAPPSRPAWLLVLVLLASSSLVIGVLSPQLTKSGSITGAVAERLVISGVSNDGNSNVQTLLTGSEHFEASFIVYVGEQTDMSVTVENLSPRGALAGLTCSEPSGLFFAASSYGTWGRVGANSYVATVPGGGSNTFRLFFKGLEEGEYQVECAISDGGGVGSIVAPPGILFAVPIIITNSQSDPPSGPFQQMVQVDSANYAAYEASDLRNVEFFAPDGTVIPSWLESGNNNAATNTIYWLKLGSQVPADSSMTVYMGFASASTNLFDGVSVGEAPQLSLAYGQYDNGANVFTFYDNFAAGSSNWAYYLASGPCGGPAGSFVVSNGLTLNFACSGDYFVTTRAFGPGTAFDASMTSFGDTEGVGYVNTGQATGVLGGPAWSGAYIRSACINLYPDQVSPVGEANVCGSPDGSLYLGTTGVAGVYSVVVLSSTSSMQSIGYSIRSTSQPISADAPNYPSPVGFTIGNFVFGNSLSSQWARVRVAPPNGVMPTASFGQVIPIG